MDLVSDGNYEIVDKVAPLPCYPKVLIDTAELGTSQVADENQIENERNYMKL